MPPAVLVALLMLWGVDVAEAAPPPRKPTNSALWGQGLVEPRGKFFLKGLVRGPAIQPGGLVLADGEGRMRTLELDDLAPLHLRLTIRF